MTNTTNAAQSAVDAINEVNRQEATGAAIRVTKSILCKQKTRECLVKELATAQAKVKALIDSEITSATVLGDAAPGDTETAKTVVAAVAELVKAQQDSVKEQAEDAGAEAISAQKALDALDKEIADLRKGLLAIQPKVVTVADIAGN